MIDFSEIFENIKDFYRENKISAIITTVLVVLFFLAMTAFIVQSCNPEKQHKALESTELPLEPDQKVLLPEGPSVPDGYALTREPHDKWTEEEAEEYFTLPDSNALKNLEEANDNLVEEILGAAP
ncbi:hypothetical protein [Treponema sp.]|uniref:hypothetical protein n=1 Tax=Treponema sp. TaxID=166 RepID=UPI00298E2712|nr:hypothetical protein [Treponema sp.]MCR5613618.1 hypothetical protein [Treponema sp.]